MLPQHNALASEAWYLLTHLSINTVVSYSCANLSLASLRSTGSLPTFQPTSSPELDALLEKFRSTVFFPAYLSEAQRRIVYRRKNHHLLTAEEPATVAIGDEVLQMHPLDPMRDQPPKNSVSTVLSLMCEIQNWSNLPSFMIGLRNSNRTMNLKSQEWIVRKACDQGNEGLIMECLRQTDKTGLALHELTLAKRLMHRALDRACEGGWTEEAVEKGLKMADSVWIMMQDPKHTAPDGSAEDPTRSPLILGVMLQLHAAKVVMFQGGNDTKGKVAEYTQRLLSSWDKLDFSNANNDTFPNMRIREWAPIWHGMKITRKFSGLTKEVGDELDIRTKEIGSAIKSVIDKVRSVTTTSQRVSDRWGEKLYDQLSKVSV